MRLQYKEPLDIKTITDLVDKTNAKDVDGFVIQVNNFHIKSYRVGRLTINFDNNTLELFTWEGDIENPELYIGFSIRLDEIYSFRIIKLIHN